jgi:hypothetical protein
MLKCLAKLQHIRQHVAIIRSDRLKTISRCSADILLCIASFSTGPEACIMTATCHAWQSIMSSERGKTLLCRLFKFIAPLEFRFMSPPLPANRIFELVAAGNRNWAEVKLQKDQLHSLMQGKYSTYAVKKVRSFPRFKYKLGTNAIEYSVRDGHKETFKLSDLISYDPVQNMTVGINHNGKLLKRFSNGNSKSIKFPQIELLRGCDVYDGMFTMIVEDEDDAGILWTDLNDDTSPLHVLGADSVTKREAGEIHFSRTTRPDCSIKELRLSRTMIAAVFALHERFSSHASGQLCTDIWIRIDKKEEQWKPLELPHDMQIKAACAVSMRLVVQQDYRTSILQIYPNGKWKQYPYDILSHFVEQWKINQNLVYFRRDHYDDWYVRDFSAPKLLSRDLTIDPGTVKRARRS